MSATRLFFDISFPHAIFLFFFFNDTATTEIYTLSLHDALPIFEKGALSCAVLADQRMNLAGANVEINAVERDRRAKALSNSRSEEHTSELQSPCNLVCRLLLEKKKKKKNINRSQTLYRMRSDLT